MSINLKEIHSKFANELKAYEQDVEEAAELEELLLFLYDNKNNQTLSENNPFNLFDKDYLNILRSDIAALLSNNNKAMKTSLSTAANL